MIHFDIEEEPEWNYRVSETSAISSSSPLGEQTDASAKGKENQVIKAKRYINFLYMLYEP